MATTEKPLPARQQRFADEYIVDLNATKAAMRAGYAERGAEVTGSRLLRNPKVAAAIAAGKEARSKRTEITQDRVIRELARLAFSDIDHYTVDELGRVQLREDAPHDAMAAVASVKRRVSYDEDGEESGVTTELKLWDKPSMLRLAGRHVGLFPDRVELTGKNGKDLVPSNEDAVRALMAVTSKGEAPPPAEPPPEGT